MSQEFSHALHNLLRAGLLDHNQTVTIATSDDETGTHHHIIEFCGHICNDYTGNDKTTIATITEAPAGTYAWCYVTPVMDGWSLTPGLTDQQSAAVQWLTHPIVEPGPRIDTAHRLLHRLHTTPPVCGHTGIDEAVTIEAAAIAESVDKLLRHPQLRRDLGHRLQVSYNRLLQQGHAFSKPAAWHTMDHDLWHQLMESTRSDAAVKRVHQALQTDQRVRTTEQLADHHDALLDATRTAASAWVSVPTEPSTALFFPYADHLENHDGLIVARVPFLAMADVEYFTLIADGTTHIDNVKLALSLCDNPTELPATVRALTSAPAP